MKTVSVLWTLVQIGETSKFKNTCKSHGRPTPTGGDQLRAGQLRFGAAASADAVLLRLKLSSALQQLRKVSSNENLFENSGGISNFAPAMP